MADLKAINPATPVAVDPPLCVDLDGTLVKSDTLIDSLLMLARSHPAAFFCTPLWACKGRAFLKGQVGSLIALDVAHLPYNRTLLDYLHNEDASGRKLYLTTGADALLARRIAARMLEGLALP